MNRRGFIGMLAAAAVAPVVPELWVPTKTIFLPPAGGWRGVDQIMTGNRLITLDELVKEAMIVLARNIEFDIFSNVKFDPLFALSSHPLLQSD